MILWPVWKGISSLDNEFFNPYIPLKCSPLFPPQLLFSTPSNCFWRWLFKKIGEKAQKNSFSTCLPQWRRVRPLPHSFITVPCDKTIIYEGPLVEKVDYRSNCSIFISSYHPQIPGHHYCLYPREFLKINLLVGPFSCSWEIRLQAAGETQPSVPHILPSSLAFSPHCSFSLTHLHIVCLERKHRKNCVCFLSVCFREGFSICHLYF